MKPYFLLSLLSTLSLSLPLLPPENTTLALDGKKPFTPLLFSYIFNFLFYALQYLHPYPFLSLSPLTPYQFINIFSFTPTCSKLCFLSSHHEICLKFSSSYFYLTSIYQLSTLPLLLSYLLPFSLSSCFYPFSLPLHPSPLLILHLIFSYPLPLPLALSHPSCHSFFSYPHSPSSITPLPSPLFYFLQNRRQEFSL